MSLESENDVIRLGGRDFEVSAFTFSQLQVIQRELSKARSDNSGADSLEQSRVLLEAALTGPGQITKEEFAELRLRYPEITDAVAAVIRISGLAAEGE